MATIFAAFCVMWLLEKMLKVFNWFIYVLLGFTKGLLKDRSRRW